MTGSNNREVTGVAPPGWSVTFDQLLDALNAVLTLHVSFPAARDDTDRACSHCLMAWPCPTITAATDRLPASPRETT